MDVLPSKPGVNCTTTERASALDQIKSWGAVGFIGGTPERTEEELRKRHLQGNRRKWKAGILEENRKIGRA